MRKQGAQIDRYLTFLLAQGRQLTYVQTVRDFLCRVARSGGSLDHERAMDFLAGCAHLAPNSRARYATYLRGYFAYIGKPFPIKVRAPQTLPPLVAEEDIKAMVGRLQQKQTHKRTLERDSLIMETAWKTGLRRSELANLRVQDLDLVHGVLKVVQGKGRKDRVVPLLPDLRDRLRDRCAGNAPGNRVFGLKPRSLGMKVRSWAKKAGVPIHTHSFRHYFATSLVQRGAHIRAVQELLGHENLATTERYLAVTASHLREAITLLAA